MAVLLGQHPEIPSGPGGTATFKFQQRPGRPLYRDVDGYTRAVRVADMPRVVAQVEEGAKLGLLWMENFFDVGNPLSNAGGPVPRAKKPGRSRG